MTRLYQTDRLWQKVMLDNQVIAKLFMLNIFINSIDRDLREAAAQLTGVFVSTVPNIKIGDFVANPGDGTTSDVHFGFSKYILEMLVRERKQLD